MFYQVASSIKYKVLSSNNISVIIIFKAIFEEFDFHDLNDRAGRILDDIKEIVRENNIDLRKILEEQHLVLC